MHLILLEEAEKEHSNEQGEIPSDGVPTNPNEDEQTEREQPMK